MDSALIQAVMVAVVLEGSLAEGLSRLSRLYRSRQQESNITALKSKAMSTHIAGIDGTPTCRCHQQVCRQWYVCLCLHL